MGVQKDFTVPVILTICFLALSICSCFAVFMHFVIKKSSLQDTASRLLFCLAVSDLIGAIMWFMDINLPGVLCPFSGVINMWGYQAAQFWTCIIGAYLIITCSAKIPPSEILFYAIAFGIPTIIQVIILCLKLYSVHPAPHGCWIQYGNIAIAFVTFPQLLSGLLNFVFLSTIVYKMRISAKRWGLQSRDRGLFFVMICFLLTTVSGILESIPHGSQTIYTIAVCFGALQGFLNSIAMKQRAILQFMGSVTNKFHPAKQRIPIRNYASPSPSPATSSTWLLADSQPDNTPKHPAMSDSYADYYARTLHSSLNSSRSSPPVASSPSSTSSGNQASLEVFRPSSTPSPTLPLSSSISVSVPSPVLSSSKKRDMPIN